MPAGTGLLAAVTPGTMQVFDDATGALRWSADITHCGVTENSYRVPYLFDDLDAIVLDLGEGRTCALDAESGAPKPIPDTPSDGSPVIFGGSVDYVGPQWAEDSTGSAYDRESGEQLWSTPTRQEERWYFAGGVLIRQRGLHIEPLG
jgi:outer membrane protein assembly factor BamB